MEAAHDSPALTLAVFSAFALFAGGFLVIASLGRWALAPVEYAPAKSRNPTQYSFGEIMLLLLQMQAAIDLGIWWSDGQQPWMLATSALACAGLLAMWWQGVRYLSRCGVISPWRRAVFLLFVSPAACAAFVAALWINSEAIINLLTGGELPWVAWLCANLAILGSFTICRIGTVWLMSDIQPNPRARFPGKDLRYVSSLSACK